MAIAPQVPTFAKGLGSYRADGRGLGDALKHGPVFWHVAQVNVGRKTKAPGVSRIASSAV